MVSISANWRPIAVVAHAKKNLGGGLPELRAELERRGQAEVGWHEVMKSNEVPDAVRAALAADPDLLLLWGGDGTVQRALDTVARKKTPDVPIAVLPAGTSNLFASNFDIPCDLSGALDVAFGGVRRRIDVGSFNGERFGVMAGVGFDALMIGDASRRMKDRLGRAAYVYTGLKNLKRGLGARRGVRRRPAVVHRLDAVSAGRQRRRPVRRHHPAA